MSQFDKIENNGDSFDTSIRAVLLNNSSIKTVSE